MIDISKNFNGISLEQNVLKIYTNNEIRISTEWYDVGGIQLCHRLMV